MTNAFPDQFNNEYSRDLEPSRGALGDTYYYQFVNFVRRYKGVRALPMPSQKASIDLISEMDDDFVRRIFLEPRPSAQAALDAAFRKYGPSATVLAMPHGGSTLPYLQDAGPDHSRT